GALDRRGSGRGPGSGRRGRAEPARDRCLLVRSGPGGRRRERGRVVLRHRAGRAAAGHPRCRGAGRCRVRDRRRARPVGRRPGRVSLTLRTATPADMAGVARIYDHYVATSTVTFELTPPGEAMWSDKLAALQGAGWPFLVADLDGAVA